MYLKYFINYSTELFKEYNKIIMHNIKKVNKYNNIYTNILICLH